MFDLSKYETVDERLHAMRAAYPNHRIITTEIACDYDKGWVRFRGELFLEPDDPFPVVTGHADGFRKDRGPEKDFWYNTAETSCLGRVLANFARNKAGVRPSREEMESVARAENDKALPPDFNNEDDWNSFIGKKADDEPIALSDAVEVVKHQLNPSDLGASPTCAHGAMMPKSGISKKTKKPYSGWVCMNFGEQCPPIWDK